MKPKLVKITTSAGTMNHLFKAQLRYMQNDYDIVIITSGGVAHDEVVKELNVRGYVVNMTRKITPFADLNALWQLVIILRKEKPFIVHTHTPKAGIVGMLAAWLTRVPHRLHTVGGLPLLVFGGKKRIILDYVEKLTYACATRVYPNSFVMKNIILQNQYTSSKKLKVIANGSSNGIDVSFFERRHISQTREQIRLELKIGEADFVFCFAGRVVKDKGINELISAFVGFYEKVKTLKIIVLGAFEKELDPVLPETEKNLLHHPGIIYLGFQKDVRPYYLASDAFVFPSYREGFPNVVMQAGAMGLPSIVTDINGCNEIIIHGENGMIIPVQNEEALLNAMCYFVNNPNVVKEMSAKARELIVSRYEQKMVWRALLEEYKSLL